MKVYTRTGDKGSTQIYADKLIRVEKDDAIVQSYGDIDELNSHLGLLAAMISNDADKQAIYSIQRNLFQAGFAISASSTLTEKDVKKLEQAIDNMSASMPAQTHFVLPGGSQAGAQSHVCRAVCRRAERSIVMLSKQHDVPAVVVAYLNRLSDYLFTFARYLNHNAQIEEIKV